VDRESVAALVAVARSATLRRWAISIVVAAGSYAATWAWGWNASLARVAELRAIELRLGALERVPVRLAELEAVAVQLRIALDSEIVEAAARDVAVWRVIVLTQACSRKSARCAQTVTYDRLLGQGNAPAIAADRALGLSAPQRAAP
jgi:hypothetical protein